MSPSTGYLKLPMPSLAMPSLPSSCGPTPAPSLAPRRHRSVGCALPTTIYVPLLSWCTFPSVSKNTIYNASRSSDIVSLTETPRRREQSQSMAFRSFACGACAHNDKVRSHRPGPVPGISIRPARQRATPHAHATSGARGGPILDKHPRSLRPSPPPLRDVTAV
ncbi:hypothetical protein GY45DRAFT_212730 [Cubamyces sp. BRFM 1775]|nr:hypothetical protein GY45DRAFT_212730 [Cubamyces sp. BRFM 1775]